MATFTAAAIQSAFVDIAKDLDVSVHRTTYLISLVIAILGGAPLFWRPLSRAYGRRPIFLLSLFCSLVGNIGCANSHSYATMGLCRAITGFFISPAAAIGSGVVSETFFRRDRARYIGVWTSMVTLGVPIAPLIFGFVALRVGYRWIYYILAIVSSPHSYRANQLTQLDQRRSVYPVLFLWPRISIPSRTVGDSATGKIVEATVFDLPPDRPHAHHFEGLPPPAQVGRPSLRYDPGGIICHDLPLGQRHGVNRNSTALPRKIPFQYSASRAAKYLYPRWNDHWRASRRCPIG